MHSSRGGLEQGACRRDARREAVARGGERPGAVILAGGGRYWPRVPRCVSPGQGGESVSFECFAENTTTEQLCSVQVHLRLELERAE
jgi:hypothetical protein